MKKNAITIVGVVIILGIFFFSFQQEKNKDKLEKKHEIEITQNRIKAASEKADKIRVSEIKKLKIEKEKEIAIEQAKIRVVIEKRNKEKKESCLHDYENFIMRFNDAIGFFYDDDSELREIRSQAITSREKCQGINSDNFVDLISDCTKQLK